MKIFRRRRSGQSLASLHEFLMAFENEIRSCDQDGDLSGWKTHPESFVKGIRGSLRQALDAPGVQVLEHAGAGSRSTLAETLDQGIQCFPIARVDGCGPFRELQQLHVQITHLAGPSHPIAKRMG